MPVTVLELLQASAHVMCYSIHNIKAVPRVGQLKQQACPEICKRYNSALLTEVVHTTLTNV